MSFQHELLIAYLAGIVDGEGYIAIRKNGNRYQPIVKVGMTDKEVVETLAETFGGFVYVSKLKSGRFIYTWQVLKKELVEVTLTALLPYLRVKRKQADHLLEFVKGYEVLPGRPAISNEEIERRVELYNKVKPLNAVGPCALQSIN